jgi:hypothetical protein
MTPRRAVVLGTADWCSTLPTNQHHVTSILQQWFDVAFVESTGLRRPEFKAQDVRRIAKRVRDGADARVEPDVGAPAVISPLVVPWHCHSAMLDVANRRAVRRAVARQVLDRPHLIWTYTPVTFGFEDVAPVVYHCVDLLGEQLGVDRRAVDRAERRLAERCAVAIASSQRVADHLARAGFSRVVLWENVGDAELFAAAADRSERVGGRVLFAGNLAPNKVDIQLLKGVSELPGVELVIAGPIAEGGGRAPAGLDDLGCARFVGPLSPKDLADLAATATVGIVPYVRNAYTSGVMPLKVYEYLGAGLRVITTDLPSLHRRPGIAALPASEFVGAVAGAASTALTAPEVKAHQELARAHSWTSRALQIRDLTDSLVDPASF